MASLVVSRILFPALHRATIIYLGPTLLADSSGLPGTLDGQPCPCLALLRVGFADPPRSPGTLVVSYTTVSPLPVGS